MFGMDYIEKRDMKQNTLCEIRETSEKNKIKCNIKIKIYITLQHSMKSSSTMHKLNLPSFDFRKIFFIIFKN